MAVKSSAVTVTTTATRLDVQTETDYNFRGAKVGQSVALNNLGSVTVYVGGSDVTTVNGYPVPAGGQFVVDLNPVIETGSGDAVYGRVASGTAEVRVLQVGV